VNPQDRQEFDRVYDRLIVQFGGADRTVAPIDPHPLNELQRLMDRVRAQDLDSRDTEPLTFDPA
jgi:hypothetical protein